MRDNALSWPERTADAIQNLPNLPGKIWEGVTGWFASPTPAHVLESSLDQLSESTVHQKGGIVFDTAAGTDLGYIDGKIVEWSGNKWVMRSDVTNSSLVKHNYSHSETVDFYQAMPDGSYFWPENLGFKGSYSQQVLPIGTKLDRFGSEAGSYLSVPGTPFEKRALGLGEGLRLYNQYIVIKPLPVLGGKIEEAFGHPGGGIQYLPNFKDHVNVEWLINNKYIKSQR